MLCVLASTAVFSTGSTPGCCLLSTGLSMLLMLSKLLHERFLFMKSPLAEFKLLAKLCEVAVGYAGLLGSYLIAAAVVVELGTEFLLRNDDERILLAKFKLIKH